MRTAYEQSANSVRTTREQRTNNARTTREQRTNSVRTTRELRANYERELTRELRGAPVWYFKRTDKIPVYFIIHFEKFSFSDGKMAAAGLDLIIGV